MSDLNQTALAEMTSEVVAIYVARTHVQPVELPGLIGSVHDAFVGLGKPPVVGVAAEPQKLSRLSGSLSPTSLSSAWKTGMR